tara:strand:- start:299 stop:1000 length:702 start_codon:yes stop_codon:yes gene_type:complete
MKNLVISLIAAKGTSKGVKKKNFLKIQNKTLLEISILSSLKCKQIDKTYVSSESEKILHIAKKYNCEIIKRPKKLSMFNAKGIEVVKHFCRSIGQETKKTNPIIILLQPTSPLRSILHIKKSLRLFKNKKLKSLISVKKNKNSPFKDMVIKNKKLKSITSINNLFKNRQEFPQTYKPNGAIFIFYYKDLMNGKSFLRNAHPYVMNNISSIDIDTYMDFKESKKYFKRIHGKFF